MKIVTIPVGLLATNCYIVYLEHNKHLYIIDPGCDADEIVDEAQSFDFTYAAILFTHGHVDHIAAAGLVAEKLKITDIYIHPREIDLFYSKNNCLLPYLPMVDNLPKVNPELKFDDFEILELPGHTRGGVGFYFHQNQVVFAGDTIFENSIGRTDFPGGDYDQLISSIRNQLFTLPDQVKLYCGHGGPTTVGQERQHNPYLQ